MKRMAIAVLACFAAGAVPAAVAQTQDEEEFVGQNCMARAALEAYLERAFTEGQVASGWLHNGHRMQLFASASGTWTMIEQTEDGGGCLIAHGSGLNVDRINLPLRLDQRF